MKLTYAVERLLETGWTPLADMELERLPDGRRFPSVLAVHREFARLGLDLQIKQNLMFGCYRASWAPAGEPIEAGHTDASHGTVIGDCEREAAVYALAQLREASFERQVESLHISEPQFETVRGSFSHPRSVPVGYGELAAAGELPPSTREGVPAGA